VQLTGLASYLFFLHWLVWGPPVEIANGFLAASERRNQFFYTEAFLPWAISLAFCLAVFGLSWFFEGRFARRFTVAFGVVVALPFIAIIAIRGFDAVEVMLKGGR
jgi:hypothetical protein